MKIKSIYEMESSEISNVFGLSTKKKIRISQREGGFKLLKSNMSSYRYGNLGVIIKHCNLSMSFGRRMCRRDVNLTLLG